MSKTFCINCGEFSNVVNAKFCPECGSPFGVDNNTKNNQSNSSAQAQQVSNVENAEDDNQELVSNINVNVAKNQSRNIVTIGDVIGTSSNYVPTPRKGSVKKVTKTSINRIVSKGKPVKNPERR